MITAENDSENVLSGRKIAYFTMEVGLVPGMKTYSGGLGVLAGDTIRSAADLNIPLVAVTLVNRMGYFRQELTERGTQIEHRDEWHPESLLTPLDETVDLLLEGRDVKVRAWLHVVRGFTGGTVPVLFLDTGVDSNDEGDRDITSYLYGGDIAYRMKQEMILGVGGARLLEKLGVPVEKYHLNEGHAAFLTLELLERLNGDVPAVRRRCVFTTHTPVEAGHDRFPYDVVEDVAGPKTIPLDRVREFAGRDHLNMTLLALNLSGYVNGVAKGHRETTERLFPGYTIRAVTNGIHPLTWTHTAFQRLYDKYFPGWANEPELLVRATTLPDQEIMAAHREAKQDLTQFVNARSRIHGQPLSPEIFTIGFARRATRYKRHTLFFSDPERLRRIVRKYPVQVIFAGKAHPRDEPGKKMIEEVFEAIRSLSGVMTIDYMENYDMDVAARLVSGVDIWLNTPLPPMEASGTSGMKAAYNGVLNFSVLDGWWIEGCVEGVTGWAIGPSPECRRNEEETRREEVEDLYGKLEYIILPLFYRDPDRWLQLMQESISKIAYYFNSHRMMRRYISEAYFG